MKPYQNPRLQLAPMGLVSALMVAPMMVLAQTSPAPVAPPASVATPAIPDGAPGNPPSTALGRAVDRATGSPTSADGTGSNPAGTALERAATPPAAPPSASAASAAGPSSIITARPRMSQIIGSSIYNEHNDKIGEVEDILIMPPPGMAMPRSTVPAPMAATPPASSTVQLVPGAPPPAAVQAPSGPVAIIQVGGFLGIGGRMVTVPLSDLRWNGSSEHIVLAGATKESLQNRPAFEYTMLRPR